MLVAIAVFSCACLLIERAVFSRDLAMSDTADKISSLDILCFEPDAACATFSVELGCCLGYAERGRSAGSSILMSSRPKASRNLCVLLLFFPLKSKKVKKFFLGFFSSLVLSFKFLNASFLSSIQLPPKVWNNAALKK